MYNLDRSGDFTGTHTPGTNIHMAGGPVNDRLHTLHIGLPSPVGAAMRVGHLNAEHDALVTKFTFSHSLEPPRWFMTPLSGASPGRCVIT